MPLATAYSRSPLRLLMQVLILVAIGAVLPACSDGEGTVYTITSVPDAGGGDPMLVFRTRAMGWDDAAQRSYTAHVEVYGTHSEEFLPMGVRSLTVFVRIYTFDGPPWPDGDDIELRSEQRATIVLAGGYMFETGQDQIEDPDTGLTKAANYIACGANGGTLMSISGNKLIRVKTGPNEVELNLDQLQGIAKLLDRLRTPPSQTPK